MGDLIRSPMNYIGGKYKLLPEILPLFPKQIDRFCDLFCGGLNVGINVDANVIYANDQIQYIIYLYEIFKTSNQAVLQSKLSKNMQKIKERGEKNGKQSV